MTTRYVGPGGNDSNDGLSWANRKLTLNGVEDTPVQAGDWIWVAPGVYREVLTVDVSGSGGSVITYAGDVTGENTDGVGGVVRVTNSDDDTSAQARNCVDATSKDYRTFRGFYFEANVQRGVNLSACTNWIIEDCAFSSCKAAVYVAGAGQAAITVRRCVISSAAQVGESFYYTHTSAVDNTGHTIENCVVVGGSLSYCVRIFRIGGIAVKNCTFIGGQYGLALSALPTAGQTITVNNCIFAHASTCLSAATSGTGYIVEDYNNLYDYTTARTNTNTGANSTTYPPLFQPTTLSAGFAVFPPPLIGQLNQWSPLRRLAGTSMTTDDLAGRTRPATDSKKSWGAVQYVLPERETTTIDGASGASLKLDDAGRTQFIVPVDAVSTTFSVAVYREADYTGTLPQMVIKQPGQSDTTVTDTGDASQWNTLSTTLTPAAAPPYVVLELVSNNTATSGNYDVFFDTVQVT